MRKSKQIFNLYSIESKQKFCKQNKQKINLHILIGHFIQQGLLDLYFRKPFIMLSTVKAEQLFLIQKILNELETQIK